MVLTLSGLGGGGYNVISQSMWLKNGMEYFPPKKKKTNKHTIQYKSQKIKEIHKKLQKQ